MADNEKVAQQQAEAKQSSAATQQPETAENISSEEKVTKRNWDHINYSNYKIPEGVSVEKIHISPHKLREGEDESMAKTKDLFATIDGKVKVANLFPNDVNAYFEKNSNGELTRRATLEQLAAKYFFNQRVPREDYSKYSMPEGNTVEKANVNQSKDTKEWRVRADINGKTVSAPLSREDVNAYFAKDEAGNRRATAEQLVGKYFNFKSEHFYEKYRMPKGVDMKETNVFKASDTGKYMVEAEINGKKMEPVEISSSEQFAYFHNKKSGERIATADQIAVRHFAPAVYQELKTARDQAVAAAKDAVIMRTVNPSAKSFNIDQSDAIDKALGTRQELRQANADKLMEAVKPELEERHVSPAWINATANEVKAIAEDYEKYKSEQSQAAGIHR